MRYFFTLLTIILVSYSLNGQNESVESRYLEQVMRLDFHGSLRHAEMLDSNYGYPYYQTITQFIRNAGQFPGEDREVFINLPNASETDLKEYQLVSLTKAAYLLYNDPSNDKTFQTLSDIILASGSQDKTPLSKLAYLLMLELYNNEIVQISEDYDKFLKQYKERAVSSHEIAWYHIHNINYITKLLDINKALSLYQNAIDDLNEHFEKYNLAEGLKAHYHFIQGVYYRSNNDFKQARESYDKAIEISGDRACLRYIKFSSYIHLVVVESELKNYGKARINLDLAKGYQNRSDSLRSEYIINRFSAEWYYEKMGVLDSAYMSLLNATIAERRLDYRKNSLRISEMNVELESAEKENEILKKDSQLQMTTRWLWIIGSMSAVLISLVILLTIAARKIKMKNEKIELLMKELHHRVKNNLQVISSLLGLQSMKLKDQSAKDAINEGKDRLKAMALIHQKLYTNQGQEIANLNIKDYLTDLIEELAKSYASGKQVKLSLQIADLEMNTDTALPLGLIVNEVVSNSYKHAFAMVDQPRLEVVLELEEGSVNVSITDNGIGLPEDFDPQKASSFGMRLIQLLTKQLGAQLRFKGGAGVSYQLSVPHKDF